MPVVINPKDDGSRRIVEIDGTRYVSAEYDDEGNQIDPGHVFVDTEADPIPEFAFELVDVGAAEFDPESASEREVALYNRIVSDDPVEAGEDEGLQSRKSVDSRPGEGIEIEDEPDVGESESDDEDESSY